MDFASLRDIDCKILCDKSSGDYADSRLLGRLAHEYRVVQGIENLVRSNRIVPCQQPELVSLHTVLGQGLVGSLHRHGRGDYVIVCCTEGHFQFCGISEEFQLVLARLRIGGVLEEVELDISITRYHILFLVTASGEYGCRGDNR